MPHLLTQDLLEQLRCSFCHEHLSVIPIYNYKENDQIVCGRCPLLSDFNPIRNHAYEKLAALFSFPCRFSNLGCLELFPLGRMESHEEECNYRQLYCPMAPLGSCPWQGPLSELTSHFNQCHKVSVLSNMKLEVNVVTDYSENYLLPLGDEVYLLHTEHSISENKVWFAMRYLGFRDCEYRYEVVLSSDNLITFELGEARMETTKDWTINKATALSIGIPEVMSALANPSCIISEIRVIKVKKSPMKNGSSSHLGLDFNEKIGLNNSFSCDFDDEMLQKLECPVCCTVMQAPIFQCVIGHSICEVCKTSCQNCPTCREPFGQTRNYLLEEVTKNLKYPCINQKHGCCVAVSAKQRKAHEEVCEFKPYECLARELSSCNWKGKLHEMIEHIVSAHDHLVLPSEDVCVCLEENEESYECNFLIYRGVLFVMHCKYINQCLYWRVVAVGLNSKEAARFTVNIDFNEEESGERIYFKKSCGEFSRNSQDVLADGQPILKVPLDMLKIFGSNTSDGFLLRYRVSIKCK